MHGPSEVIYVGLSVAGFIRVSAVREKGEKNTVLVNYSLAYLLEMNPVSQPHVHTVSKHYSTINHLKFHACC